MKNVLIAVMVLALAATAFADQNPNIRIFLNASSAGTGANWTTTPGAGSIKSVYVCFDNFGVGGGMYAAQFHMMPVGGPDYVSTANQFVGVGGLTIGEAVVAPGAAMTVGPVPVYPDASGIIVLARVRFETPEERREGGHIALVDYSAGDGNVVADADNMLDTWCVKSVAYGDVSGHFGWDAPPPIDGDCIPPSPVESTTWGSIKALYR